MGGFKSIEQPKAGDKVLILRPAYVAGKVGEVCGKEILSSGEPSDRWLIQVDSENILVSLYLREFQALNQND
ncbi:MAG: hypothetical protein PUP91_25740 [Rhizonema sp. PD37]|nr:hypothetical protein [Rhizonema sp. PD37]